MLAASSAGQQDGDDVSNIHRRWSFTRITPGSIKASYSMLLACGAIVVAVSHVFHLKTGVEALAVHLPLGLAALAGLTLVDFAMLRGTPVNKLSKVVHVSSFASLLWALTVVVSVLADAVFAKAGTGYIVAGMLLAAGLRIGIFTSVFGAGMGRALAVCLVQPVVFLLAFVPPSRYYDVLFGSPAGLGFGALFVALAALWAILADRAGRPQVRSTFRLLQAFLSAWTENKTGGMEEYFESKASSAPVSTHVLQFMPLAEGNGSAAAIVLPDVHPGPFGMVGGSNLPYVLYGRFAKRALVMHSVSGHSLNLPSARQVDAYVAGLDGLAVAGKGGTCSEPVQRRQGNATATAIAFGDSVLVMLSLAPKGMEDVPSLVRDELASYASRLGFARVMVVDCHNAMGGQIGDADRADLLSAARACLEDLKSNGGQSGFAAGFAAAGAAGSSSPELGQAGLAALVLRVKGKNYAILWADSNNMENSLRDKIIEGAGADNVRVLEVCTSDTHATSGRRTREGYFALGAASDHGSIVQVFARLCKEALKDSGPCRFELASATSEVRVMGAQFGDYSSALDRSMRLTKVFVAITFAAFVAMQVLA
jgi:putative membrane protein